MYRHTLFVLSLFASAVPALAAPRPETTRRYLHAPRAERLGVLFREGMLLLGENVHSDDWQAMPYARQVSQGAWLVRGADDEPHDFRQAALAGEPDGAPLHAQSWREGDVETLLAVCSTTDRKSTLHARITLVNRGTAVRSGRLGFLLRTAPEEKLVFGAPDIYAFYDPRVAAWKDLPCAWTAAAPGLVRDGARFAAFSEGVTWDAAAGVARWTYALAPGARRTFELAFGIGPEVRPDYAATARAARADWTAILSRARTRTPFVRSQVVQMLQCFGRPTDGAFVLPRQGGLQRGVWPGETMYVTAALDRLGYGDFVEDALDFLFRFAKEDGQIGPFKNGWASETAYVLAAFSRHGLQGGDRTFWRRHYAAALRAFRWIARVRAENAGDNGAVPGLFPPRKSTDSTLRLQHWGMTDLVNENALGIFADAAAHFGEPETEAIRAEWKDYRATIERILERWRAASAGKDTFFIPLAPDGSHEADLRARHFFYLHPGAFAAGGYLTEDEMLRLRRWLVRAGIAEPDGLYQRHTSPRPELGRRVWYTIWSESQWAAGWRRVGRRDLAHQALDTLLRRSVTAENYVGERVHEKTPWFFPWSPNASGSARLVNMILDEEADARGEFRPPNAR